MLTDARYEDNQVRCDDDALVIKHYYPWGAKRVPYSSIRSVKRWSLTGVSAVRRWRIWGSGDFIHWWNLDTGRPRKDTALVLDLGGRVKPVITPDDADAVAQILDEHQH